MKKHSQIEFFVGKEGDFDALVTRVISRLRREKCGNFQLHLVLPYHKALPPMYHQIYDSVFIADATDAATVVSPPHFKRAIVARNHWMVNHCNLLICYTKEDVEKSQAALICAYAKEHEKEVINLLSFA